MEKEFDDYEELEGKKLLLFTLIGDFNKDTMSLVKQIVIEQNWPLSWADDLSPGVSILEFDTKIKSFDIKEQYTNFLNKLPKNISFILQDVTGLNSNNFTAKILMSNCNIETIDIIKSYKEMNDSNMELDVNQEIKIEDIKSFKQWKLLSKSVKRELVDIALDLIKVKPVESKRLLDFASKD